MYPLHGHEGNYPHLRSRNNREYPADEDAEADDDDDDAVAMGTVKPASDVTGPTAHSPLRLCNLSVAQLLITMALVPSASSL